MEKIVLKTDSGEVVFRPRTIEYSTFYKFDELQGIVGNSGGPHYSKTDSCYVPAKELLKKSKVKNHDKN